MEFSQSYALTLTLVVGLEYWLKEWWESIDAKFTSPFLSYVCYRLIHFVLLFTLGLVLYTNLGLKSWAFWSACFVIMGSLEIILMVVHFKSWVVWEINFFHPGFLVLSLLVICSNLVSYDPTFALDHRILLLFVFSAHPSNYIVRWTFNKHEPSLAKTIAFLISRKSLDDYPAYPLEVAATLDKEGKQDLGVGRRIGTLERWLILLFILSDNVSNLGLVIAAKSIVRYPKLGDPEFAEYYLLGTLLSVVLALASAFLLLGGI